MNTDVRIKTMFLYNYYSEELDIHENIPIITEIDKHENMMIRMYFIDYRYESMFVCLHRYVDYVLGISCAFRAKAFGNRVGT